MTGAVVAWSAWVPGGLTGLADDLRAGRRRGPADDPARPEWLAFAHWRRMSRLTRAAAVAVGEVLGDRDRALPVVWGTAFGEVPAGSAFLDRLTGEGPDQVSPAAFQDSVYNATLGRLAIAFGLTGPQETVCAGGATGLAALARGLEWLDRAPHVLVVAGDAGADAITRALGSPGGDAVVALLLARGAGVEVRDGAGSAPVAARGTPLPYEDGFAAVAAPVRPEATLGHTAVGELLAFLVLAGPVVAHDDGVCLTLR